ncbi:hypothetical protein [Calidifontibacter terrae]
MDQVLSDARSASAQPSRRSVAKGLAWAVPVITAGAAVPAMALSAGPPTFTFLTACKSPGNSCTVFPKGYDFRFNVCNNTGVTAYIYTVIYSDVVGSNLSLTQALPALPAAIPSGGCTVVVYRANSSNSANAVFTATMTLTWGHTPNPGGDPYPHPNIVVPIAVTGTSPDCPCSATPSTAASPARMSATTSSSTSSPSSTTSSSTTSSTSSSSTSAPASTSKAAPSSAPVPSTTEAPAATSAASSSSSSSAAASTTAPPTP